MYNCMQQTFNGVITQTLAVRGQVQRSKRLPHGTQVVSMRVALRGCHSPMGNCQQAAHRCCAKSDIHGCGYCDGSIQQKGFAAKPSLYLEGPMPEGALNTHTAAEEQLLAAVGHHSCGHYAMQALHHCSGTGRQAGFPQTSAQHARSAVSCQLPMS